MNSVYYCSGIILGIHILIGNTNGLPQGIKNEMPPIKQSDLKEANDEKRTNTFAILSGRTKNSVLNHTIINGNKEMNICFPYFIAQDVDAFLSQATDMLNKPLNDSQRSWLQLFVHRLERLSKKLKSLPSEHKTACFQKRQSLISGTNIENGLLNLTPEEAELKFAKQIFDGQEEPHLRRIHPKEYVVGTVLRKFSGPRAKNINRRDFSGKHVYSLPMPLDESPPRTEVRVEDLNRNSPYFMRSARKIIPWQVLERLNHRNANSNKESDLGPNTEVVSEAKIQQSDDHQVAQPSTRPPDLVKANSVETDSFIKTSTSIYFDVEKVVVPSERPVKSSNNDDDEELDDVVLQLHSGRANSRKAEIIVTVAPENIEPMGTQDKTEITEPVTIVQKLPAVTQERHPDLQKPTMYELFDESGVYPRQDHKENNLDFDYEEQGAAAGELYNIEEDNAPSKPSEVIPSASSGISDNPRPSIHEDDDDAVLQLRALKNPVSTLEPTTFNNPKNADTVNKILPRIAGPAGRVHRSHKIHVDDKK